MPRQVVAPRLGIGGRNTEKATWALSTAELQDGSQDGVILEGKLQRRRGAKVALNAGASIESVYRYRSSISGRTATMVGLTPVLSPSAPVQFSIYFPEYGISYMLPIPSSTFGLASFAKHLPRAVYRGDVLWCGEDGIAPMIRSNVPADVVSVVGSGTASTTAGQNIVSFATSLVASPGAYCMVNTGLMGPVFPRVLSVSGNTVTVEGISFNVTQNIGAQVYGVGAAYPAVAVHSDGTVSDGGASGTVTGVGTAFTKAFFRSLDVAPQGLLLALSDGSKKMLSVNTTAISAGLSDTSLVYSVDGAFTNLQYKLTQACPFKDVCVYNNTLYGVGVAQFPSRVYVAPPGWDMSSPPGATSPWKPDVAFTSSNESDFLLDFVDVASPFDVGDPIVAILATDGPRLVLKQSSTWGLYGEPPNLQPRLLNSSDGCIDIRTAISTAAGAFWGGADGVYRYYNGQIRDLTSGWMQTEWRTLVKAGVDFAAFGVDGRHLVVSIGTADAAQKRRTYLYDLELERWLPEITNIHPEYMFTANLSGQIQSLLCVDTAYPTKVINLSPALDATGPARDEVGSGPAFKLVTGDSFTEADGIEGEVRAIELDTHTVVSDPAGTTTLAIKVLHGGSLNALSNGEGFKYDSGVKWDSGAFWGPYGCRSVGSVSQATHDEVVRSEFPVNRTGRRIRLQVEETTTSTTVGEVSVGETILRVKDMRRGS